MVEELRFAVRCHGSTKKPALRRQCSKCEHHAAGEPCPIDSPNGLLQVRKPEDTHTGFLQVRKPEDTYSDQSIYQS